MDLHMNNNHHTKQKGKDDILPKRRKMNEKAKKAFWKVVQAHFNWLRAIYYNRA